MALHDLATMEIPPSPFISSSSSSTSSSSENGRYFECIPSPAIVKYTKLFIDGSFVDSISGRTFATIDPRNGEVIARVAEADSDDVDVAVRAARKAFQEGPWPRMTGYERGRVLFKFADLVERSIEELSMLETLDNGKPLLMSRNVDFSASIKLLRHCAGWADKISGSTLKVDGPFHAYTLYEPMGVVGAIIPWNFPSLMFMMKLAPALAAGNCLVIKSAEQTPLSALHLASIAKEAGVPNGVINVLSGFGASVGAAIASHMDIDKISFTGSTEVGRLIMKASAESNMKNVTLELGGKSPLIICQDADIDIALEISHEAVFFNQGQCCFAATRTFVHEDIYDEFVEKASKKAKVKIVGDPFRKEVEQGPQIDETQLHRILSYIELGKKEGARLVAGGSRLGSQGYFIEPTVFADVQDDMKIAQDEIFGPVMQILKFKTMEEVITRANNTRYGLAVGIITKDMDVAHTLSRSIKAGVVWLNCYSMLDPSIPFGGYKMSGIGREQGGVMGILNYMQVKSVIAPLTKGSPWL